MRNALRTALRRAPSYRSLLERNRCNRAALLAAAGTLALLGAGSSVARSADFLLNSFETGGMDTAPDEGVTLTPFQTTGVTDGQFSLKVDIAPQSWWIDTGHINVDPSAVVAHQVLKFDITTPTGVQLVPIFLPNSGSFYYQGPGISVGASSSAQTMTWDYSAIGLPADATQMQIRFQASNGSGDISYFMDNVRVGTTVQYFGDPASWKTNGSGDWGDSANWDPHAPGLPGSFATFDTHNGDITTTNQIVVTLPAAATVVDVTFNKGGGGYKIAGGVPLNVTRNVVVQSGNHVISAPLNVSSGTIFNIADNTTLTADILGGGGFGTLQKDGGGTLTTDKVQNVSVDVTSGTWNLKPGNAQNNGWIFGLTVENGTRFNMNGASIRNNALSGTGIVDLGNGGAIRTGLYSGAGFDGVITGAGSVAVGDASETNDTSVTTVTFSGNNTYTGGTRVTNGKVLVINPTGNIGSGTLTVDADSVVPDGAGGFVPAQLQVVAARTSALKVAGLSVANTGTVDLADNDIVVGSGTPRATVQGYINNARDGGAWDRPGLTSSTAKVQSSHATTLGVLSGAEYSSVGGTGVFGGQSYGVGDTLVKYTWYGDTDFNGRVNFDDYVRTDNGFNNHLSGWLNGDFDGNGAVNFDDYVLIDLAFNTQSGTLGRALAFLDGSDTSLSGMNDPALRKVRDHLAEFGSDYGSHLLAAVPEPATMSILMVAPLAALSRRRRNGR
jgi:autotransporter-associated beta strand protein